LFQVWDTNTAFERIEEWLGERGFLAAGGEELEADLYLGYVLSQSIRRDTTPAPPDPAARFRSRHVESESRKQL
jgi:hypothetical protein